MLVAIRLKGSIKVRGDMDDTMQMLGLKRKHTAALLQDKPETRGMLRKANDFIAWGEASAELEKEFKGKKAIALKPPRGGFRSLKEMYPRGDMGYRGEKISELIRRMM